MSKELQRYGIKMPAFQKIGGILSSNIDGDIAALHAAIINVNNAVDFDDDIESSLLNPTAQLKYILPNLLPTYHIVLQHAKKLKLRNILSRSMNDSYMPDVYDELLTQAEIQGYILNVNTSYSVSEIFKTADNNDDRRLFDELKPSWLQLKNLNGKNSHFYLDLLMNLDVDHKSLLKFADFNKLLQAIVDEGNSNAEAYDFIKESVKSVNVALDGDNCKNLYNALVNLNGYVKFKIEEFSMPLFHEELRLAKMELDEDLGFDDISKNCRVLSATAHVSKVLDFGNQLTLWDALNDGALQLRGLRFGACQDYQRSLKSARSAKRQAALPCTLLTLLDVQDCIDDVNTQDDLAQDCKIITLIFKYQIFIVNDHYIYY